MTFAKTLTAPRLKAFRFSFLLSREAQSFRVTFSHCRREFFSSKLGQRARAAQADARGRARTQVKRGYRSP